ncbi:MAG TPA: sugar kinase [Polyangiaceae bacterium]|nr:sugar kinase [Polyangiaceae bacterium]
MIVSRAPFRFSLGGGGTDLPAYYRQHGGFVVSAAIDSYMYVTANRRFYPSIRLAYSETEIVNQLDEIRHPIFREALKMLGIDSGIELTSVADLPSNSGLGSSSSFTVALLNALYSYKREFVAPERLAREACELEMVRLGEPVGKQDQYIAAYGNVTALRIATDGSVEAEPVPLRPGVLEQLSENLLIVYSGVQRPAKLVLTEQTERVAQADAAVLEGMHRIKALGLEVYDLLASGKLDRYGELLDEHWQHKRKLASRMTDETLDQHYAAARQAGAVGGKLIGAGGGGFFMLYVRKPERSRVQATLAARGLQPLPFRFDLDGARILLNPRRAF